MESWIFEKLKLKTLSNYSLDQCFLHLKRNIVPLHEYDIVCVGYENNNKSYAFIKIIASSPASKTLQGPHEVLVYMPGETSIHFWVWSLTTLRKRFLKFTDRLSFERSAFLILPTEKVLLRLKTIRSIVQTQRKLPYNIQKLPIYNQLYSTPPSDSAFVVPPIKKQTRKVCIRSKLQQQNFLEQSLTTYLREFENTPMTKQAIFQKFRNDIIDKLKILQKHYEDEHEESRVYPELEEILEETFMCDDVDEEFDLHDDISFL